MQNLSFETIELNHANKIISSFLITPDTLIQTLALDDKIVGEYSIPYLDNTGICVLD